MFTVACSTVPPKRTAGVDLHEIPENKTALQTLQIKGSISTDFQDQSLSGSFTAKIAGRDSLQLTLYGPFSILIGRLHADKNSFTFYNAYNEIAYKGKPSSESMYTALMIPMSFGDIISILRQEYPGNREMYRQEQNDKDDNSAVFIGETEKNAETKAIFDNSTGTLKKIIRSINTGVVYEVNYNNYSIYSGYYLAEDTKVRFVSAGGEMIIDIDEVKINPEFKGSFRFDIPKKTKTYYFD